MNFESASGLSNDDLEALALKLLGTQDRLDDHNDSGIDGPTLEDDLYDGQFAAICSYCGFWVRPDLLDHDEICEACIQQIEEEEMDDIDDGYIVDDDPADVDDNEHEFVREQDWYDEWELDDPDFDDDDDIFEEEWDDADLDGIDDWEDDEDD